MINKTMPFFCRKAFLIKVLFISFFWLLGGAFVYARNGEVSQAVLGVQLKDKIIHEKWGQFLAMRSIPQWGFLEGRPHGEFVRILKTYHEDRHAFFSAFPQSVAQEFDYLAQFDRELWYLFQSYSDRRGFSHQRISGFVESERHLNALLTTYYRYRSDGDHNLIPDAMLRIVDGTRNALGGPLMPVEKAMKFEVPERSEQVRVNGKKITPAVIEIGRTIIRAKLEPGDAEKGAYGLFRLLYEVGGYIDRRYLSQGRPAVLYIHTETIGKKIFGREPYGFEWQPQFSNSDHPDEVVMRMDGEEFLRRFGSSRELDFIPPASYELESSATFLNVPEEKVFMNLAETMTMPSLKNSRTNCEDVLVPQASSWPWVLGAANAPLEEFNPASASFQALRRYFQQEIYQTTPASQWSTLWDQRAPYYY